MGDSPTFITHESLYVLETLDKPPPQRKSRKKLLTDCQNHSISKWLKNEGSADEIQFSGGSYFVFAELKKKSVTKCGNTSWLNQSGTHLNDARQLKNSWNGGDLQGL